MIGIERNADRTSDGGSTMDEAVEVGCSVAPWHTNNSP